MNEDLTRTKINTEDCMRATIKLQLPRIANAWMRHYYKNCEISNMKIRQNPGISTFGLLSSWWNPQISKKS